MVKGNWERRAELVAARRIEERNRKAQKAVGSRQMATAESVITKVQRDPILESDGCIIEVWLQSDLNTSVCKEWLRSESCSTKRCKHTHKSNISQLRNLLYVTDSDDSRTECLPDGPTLLSNVARKDYIRLLFLAINGECVYDKSHPELWERWIEQRTQFVKGLDRTTKLRPICETNEDEVPVELDTHDTEVHAQIEEDMESLKLSQEGAYSNPSQCGDFSQFFLDANHQAIVPFNSMFTRLVRFLTTSEARNVSIANKALFTHCQRVDAFRLRRREALTFHAAELSKIKKTEQKKKVKQAYLKKDSKKDAFARGGNGS